MRSQLLPSKLISNITNYKWSHGSGMCNLCGCKEYIGFSHQLYPDFAVNSDLSFIAKFKVATDGVCLNCGHFQRFSCLSEQELNEYLEIYEDKRLTSQGIVSEKSKDQGKIDARTDVISKALDLIDIRMKKILVARPTSGITLRRVCEIAISKMSDVWYIENDSRVVEEIKSLGLNPSVQEGEVHGRVELGDCFDVYIIVHILQHAINLSDTFRWMKGQCERGAHFILVDEVQRKLHNPFHVNHFTESFLRSALYRFGMNSKIVDSELHSADVMIAGLQASTMCSCLLIENG